jgi:hypothetical protein
MVEKRCEKSKPLRGDIKKHHKYHHKNSIVYVFAINNVVSTRLVIRLLSFLQPIVL